MEKEGDEIALFFFWRMLSMLNPHLLFCFFGDFGALEVCSSAGGEGLMLLDEEEERRDVDVDAVDRRVVEVLVIVFVGPAG
jgi:hypothetical protein